MTSPLGIGIIGCGNISTTYFTLAPLFRGLEIRACTDVNPAAAEARGRRSSASRPRPSTPCWPTPTSTSSST